MNEENKKLIMFDFDGVLVDTLFVGNKIVEEINYDNSVREIKIPNFLKEIVSALAKKYILVIISSGGTSSIKKILEKENVYGYFNDILGNDVNTSKISKIKIVLEKYNILPKNSIFITDTLSDTLEAKECEVKSIAVTWGFNDRKTLEKGNPIVIIDDPRDLLEAIQNVLK